MAGVGPQYLTSTMPDTRAALLAIAEAVAEQRRRERTDLAARIAEGTRKVIDGK